jgi:hypothetical protein
MTTLFVFGYICEEYLYSEIFLFFHKMPVIFLKQPHGDSLYCEKEFVKTINYVPFTSPALVSPEGNSVQTKLVES